MLLPITITRTGADPVDAVAALLRGAQDFAGQYAEDRISEAVSRGDMTAGRVVRTLQVGSSRRAVSLFTATKKWPVPPYDMVATEKPMGETESLQAVADAVAFTFTGTKRINSGKGRRKNHPYRYRQSFRLFRNGRPMAGLPRPASMSYDDRYLIVNVAPHSSVLEYRGLMAKLAAETIRAFPRVAISFFWITSDELGLTYGRGSGGPSREGTRTPVPYALPAISIRVGITATIGKRKRAKRNANLTKRKPRQSGKG